MSMTKPLALAMVVAYGLGSSPGPGVMEADLRPQTVAAFDRYVSLVEARIDGELRRPDGFLYLDRLAEAKRSSVDSAVRRGEVVVESQEIPDQGRTVNIPDGRVHHWLGLAFMPGVRVADAVKLLQDYDRHAEIYAPSVQRSKILSRNGDRFHVFLRFTQKKVITVTVNSEHDAEFFRLGPDRVHSRIRSTRIAEVADAGTPTEHEKPVGRDGGYLWRLNTYWRVLERDGGTYIQCESLTLTRDIPFGVGWLVGPFVTSIPRESLSFTMQRMRKALTANPSL
jgi:hypothetical protein